MKEKFENHFTRTRIGILIGGFGSIKEMARRDYRLICNEVKCLTTLPVSKKKKKNSSKIGSRWP
jgi:hypothetical protein